MNVEMIMIDQQQYLVLKEIPYHNIRFVFLSNVMNPDDVLIRKRNRDTNQYIPLESVEEVHLASFLLYNSI